ncbi:probable serine/threonine-protein kinase pats1 [Mytilus californianus]|uniref:probable serine/threonine-protein kinase pats1 n=1 Tax=Mytilus californianus TaxID=6549 RepID=UPI0022475A39|nr:probable serine/threonine-protein kinase pats1 [Mytilus californianus]
MDTRSSNDDCCNGIRTLTYITSEENDLATYKFIASNMIGTTESDPVQLNDDKRQTFIHEIMLKGECEKVHFARLVFIGKNGSGKTSLMRRLLGQNKEDVNSTQNTDGIDVGNCNINIKDGKWSQCDEISDDLTRLIQEVYRENVIAVERSASSKNMHQDHLCSNTDEIRTVSDDTEYSHSSGQKEQAFCWLWEFAGQKDFYAIHQVFLSNCAVFLLVIDSLKFTTSDNIGTDIEDLGQYVSFWFDAIHCYRSTSTYYNYQLDPPIIVVCTKEDKFKEPLERQKREFKLQEYLENVLEDRFQEKHLRRVYCVSNTEDLDDVFEKIRNDLSRQIINMKALGRVCPLNWFLFQKVLGRLMESGVPISTTTQLFQIAKHEDIGITNDEEFKLCLQHCHENGIVIYFEEENLKDVVILDPKWLADAFRCPMFDKTENLSNVSDHVRTLTETGELTESLIYDLFTKEPKLKLLENKTHLLEVMKRFDIIVNLKNSTALYMPCMMKSCPFEEFRKQFFDSRQSFYKTSWFCLQFQFLPPDFFNHILAWYIKQYSVSMFLEKGTRNEMKALYRQIGVFDLDLSGWEKLVVCEGPNVIALQVWNSRNSCQTYGKLRTDLVEFVYRLRHRYKLKIKFIKTFKCKDGDFKTKRQNLNDLISFHYQCLEHKTLHVSNHLVEPWEFSTELM